MHGGILPRSHPDPCQRKVSFASGFVSCYHHRPVKSYLPLLGLALALAFASGAILLAPEAAPERGVPREELDALLIRFARETPPAQSFAPAQLFASGHADALLDPGGLLPRTAGLPLDELSALATAVSAGRFPPALPLTDPLL